MATLLDVREHIPLARFTTFGVGGPARYFAEIKSEQQLIEALEFAQKRGLPTFVLGGGSNLIVSDTGFAGVVLQIGMRGICSRDVVLSAQKRLFSVAAGEEWDAFVSRTVADNCAGVECLSGIPGLVGGTPVQNVGAYGQEVAETIQTVRVYDHASRDFVDLSNPDCGFSYRTSIFNSTQRDRYIVTSVTFALSLSGDASIRYADVKRVFPDGSHPSLAEVRAAVLKIRAAKGMVIDPADPDSRSAGSFFKNPILTNSEFAVRRSRLDAVGKPYSTYPAGDGHVKLSAAWLIESAGFHRGYGDGRVGISSKHTLALINRGGATAADVLSFARRVQDGVRAHFDIDLHPEPVMLGFD